MAKPTERQRYFLQNRGIAVPATKAACSTLIDYVKKGNGAGSARTESERIAVIRAVQRQWNSERVHRRDFPGEQGIVRYVLAYRSSEVREYVLTMKEVGQEMDPRNLSPFKALVEWDEARSSQLALALLERI